MPEKYEAAPGAPEEQPDEQDTWIKKLKDSKPEGGEGWLINHVIENLEQENRRRIAAEQESVIDPLTQLLNRRGFEKMLKGLFSKKIVDTAIDPRREPPSEKPPRSIALLMADINRFKGINDHLGHAIGDLAIKNTAEHLEELSRKNDLVGREGGDEFLVAFLNALPEDILKRIPKKGTIYDTKDPLEGELNFTIELPDHDPPKAVKVSLCGGLVNVDFPEGCSPEEAWKLVEAAKLRCDQLLYEAKGGGRNCILMEQPGKPKN